jgi:predicted nucleotidyltransferase
VSEPHRLDGVERAGILARLAAELEPRSDVIFAYAYGSFVTADVFRDIDVAIWVAGAAGRLDVDLANELSRVTGYPVDVRVVNQAPMSFQFHVLRGQALVVHDDRLVADLIERTARTYHDQEPLARRAVREAFGT